MTILGTSDRSPPGFGFQNNNKNLYISGDAGLGEIPLFIQPVEAENNNLTLFLQAGHKKNMPLFIGNANNYGSGNVPLFVRGDVTTWGGGDNYQGYAPLFIRSNGKYFPKSAPLYIGAPSFATYNNNIPLLLEVSDVDDRKANDNVTLYISGDPIINPNNPLKLNDSTTLFIRSENEFNKGIPLHIESDVDLGAFMTLFVKSQLSSKNTTLFTDGIFRTNNNLTLFIKGPTNNERTLFTRGYSE